MPDLDDGRDDQDQSETFDETHLDDEGDGEFLLDEADGVLDVTQAEGDADEDDFDEDDQDLDDELGASGIEAEADAILGGDRERLNQIDAESDGLRGEDEVELVYSGLMENERGAQASAAHWEAKTLSDDDIDDLGYGPDGAEQQEQIR
ncbi:hypothetical protein [Brevundimonas goettingensis]|uniref:Uncharacterized protein n=1 Tax=Brevundimonas goettingensis TaxID=2774190 RepID=A0A975BYF9_9CAUL|nr:hypothetical protein [Brevundimonas goettingensis]QTC89818.1 hypothetical protein IFJ75_10925 [Brevundimonas goettingensis]